MALAGRLPRYHCFCSKACCCYHFTNSSKDANNSTHGKTYPRDVSPGLGRSGSRGGVGGWLWLGRWRSTDDSRFRRRRWNILFVFLPYLVLQLLDLFLQLLKLLLKISTNRSPIRPWPLLLRFKVLKTILNESSWPAVWPVAKAGKGNTAKGRYLLQQRSIPFPPH